MIKEIVQKWEENKAELEEYFRTTKQEEYDTYEKIVRKIFDIVINTSDSVWENFYADKMTVIDDGDYQGTQLFIIPKRVYQPCVEDYLMTDTDYGSCAGCDTLQSIAGYNYDKLPSSSQVRDYMTLSLHLIQKMRWLVEPNTDEQDED
jgi:hypothetical protein